MLDQVMLDSQLLKYWHVKFDFKLYKAICTNNKKYIKQNNTYTIEAEALRSYTALLTNFDILD